MNLPSDGLSIVSFNSNGISHAFQMLLLEMEFSPSEGRFIKFTLQGTYSNDSVHDSIQELRPGFKFDAENGGSIQVERLTAPAAFVPVMKDRAETG